MIKNEQLETWMYDSENEDLDMPSMLDIAKPSLVLGSSENLLMQLAQKNDEIKRLQKQINDMASLNQLENDAASPDKTMMDSFRDQKLVELAKKTRTLTISLEKEKTKCQQYEKQLKKMEMNEKKQKLKEEEKSESKEGKVNYKEQLSQYQRRLEEERILMVQLKTENKKLIKLLKEEIGQDFDIKNINQTTGWKGRAQEIIKLKEKIRVLSAKPTANTQAQEQSPAPVSNRKALEIQQSDLEALNQELQKLKERNSYYKIRNKNLEDQIKDLKEKFASVLEKTALDDTYIQALKKELEKYKQHSMDPDNLKSQLHEKQAQILDYQEKLQNFTSSPPSNDSSDNKKMKTENEKLRNLCREYGDLLLQLHLKNDELENQMKTTPAILPRKDQDLTRKVLMQEDEIASLKATLKSYMQRKENEIKMYHDLLEQEP